MSYNRCALVAVVDGIILFFTLSLWSQELSLYIIDYRLRLTFLLVPPPPLQPEAPLEVVVYIT